MERLLSRVVAHLLLLLLAVCPAFAGDGPAEPPDPAAVDAAIERGVAYVRKAQSANGSWDRDRGKTALGLYVLAHAGVEPDDRSAVRALRWVLGNLGRPDTYGASLAVMALATLDREAHAKRIARLARLLQIGQCDNGQWSYKLKGGRSAGDNSNTQFALLALWYADRAGASVESKLFSRTLQYFLSTQNEDGGWGYSAKERAKSYGSMSATGLAAIVVCRSGLEGVRLADEKARRDPEVAKAAKWIENHLKVDCNPEANFKFRGGMREVRKEVTDSYWRFYWLWSLERAAAVAGIDRFGERDWYAEGAARLLMEQRDNGSWVGSETPFLATSFAVLFLTRSTGKAVATEAPKLGSPATPEPR